MMRRLGGSRRGVEAASSSQWSQPSRVVTLPGAWRGAAGGAAPERPGPEGPAAGAQDPNNPFSVLEQFGQQVFQNAQQVAQRVAEAANSRSATPVFQDMQGFVNAAAAQVNRHAMPIFTAMLILARAPAGQPLTAEQQEKIEQIFPNEAKDLLQRIGEVIPEDPQVTQLRRIADRLELIEAKLDAAAPAGARASDALEASGAAATFRRPLRSRL
eukprot:CAMPEP_0170260784 /NCGR_PEP_ID=MMETSP0116_2-20130129/30270_1 /TAXON_ID=400756 /ORGANISM="Durinskia baltica, Strain CSIRO CS-38" /LENGTH=213 /DNA_ID=CAMNT_0010511843 /DNA_START=50 /DNA_END=689 /DNA_ORIENTATION=+